METKTRNPIGNSVLPQDANLAVQEIKETVHHAAGIGREKLSEGAAFAREHPAETAIAGIGIGFLLAHLPLRRLIGSALRLTLFLVKPAALIYGIAKMREAFRAEK